MISFLLVALGGAVGSVLRYGIGKLFPVHDATHFPFATLTVNLAGCLIIGIVFGLIEKYQISSHHLRYLLAVGFCGGFTTFSAFSYESLQMLQSNNYVFLTLYMLGSLLFGVLLTYTGYLICK